MKKYLFSLFAIVAILFSSCNPTVGGGAPDVELEITLNKASSDKLNLKVSVPDSTATIKDLTAAIYLKDTEVDKISNTSNTDIVFNDLRPNTEYTVKVTANLSDGLKGSVEKNFTTTAPVSPEFTLEFVSEKKSYVKITSEEFSYFSNIIVKRSEEKDGEYVTVGTIFSSSLTCKDNDIKENTTYWYKLVCSNSEDKVDVESEPKSILTDYNIPEKINSNYVEVKTGYTTATLTWPEQGDVQYLVKISNSNSSLTKEPVLAETNKCLITGLTPGKSYYAYVAVKKGDAVSDYTSGKFFYTENIYYSGSFTVEPGPDSIKCIIPLVKNEYNEDFTVRYDYYSHSSRSEKDLVKSDLKVIEDKETGKGYFIYDGLKPLTDYGTAYIYPTLIYTDYKGEQVEYEINNYTYSYDMETTFLVAPSNLTLKNTSKTKAEFTFDALTEAQKLGYSDSEFEYRIAAYKAGSSVSDVVAENVTPDNAVVTGLTPNTNYEFKVYAYNESAGTKVLYSDAVTGKTNDYTLKSKPGIANITQVYEDPTNESALPDFIGGVIVEYTPVDAVEASAIDVVYGIECKLFDINSYNDCTAADNPTDKQIFAVVNGGNTYKFRVFAKDKDEPVDIVYSEPMEFNLSKIDDSIIDSLMVYTGTSLGGQLGEAVDLRNPNLVEVSTDAFGFEPFNVGYSKEDMGENSGMISTYKFSVGDLYERTIPKLIFIDANGMPVGENYGYFDYICTTIPYGTGVAQYIYDCTKTFTIEKKYELILNMPTFRYKYTTSGYNLAADNPPSKYGFKVLEDMVFNDAVYITVGQSKIYAGPLAFAYYY